MAERRLHQRRHIEARVRLYHSNCGSFDGMIHDVSPGGMYVLLEEMLSVTAMNGDRRFHLEPKFMDVIFDMDCLRITENGIVLVFGDEEEKPAPEKKMQ